MSVPLATTTIAILRRKAADVYAEPYAGLTSADRDVVSSGVRAVIDAPSGSQDVAGGEQTRSRFRLAADPCDLHRTDWVRDERTGVEYQVSWVLPFSRPNGAASHVEAGLDLVEGLI